MTKIFDLKIEGSSLHKINVGMIMIRARLKKG